MQESTFLRKLSIKHRLLIAFLITSLLPVFAVAFYSNMRYEASISEKLSASTLQVLSESAINATRELAQYETLSESIIINNLIQDGFKNVSHMNDYEKYELQTNLKDELGEQVFRLSNISNVVLLTNGGEAFFDLGFEWYPNNQIVSALQDLATAPGNIKWTYLRSNRGSDKIALSRIIYSEEDLNVRLGYLIIVIDEKVFSRNTFEHVDLGKGGRIYIANSRGVVVSSVSPSIAHGQVYNQDAVFKKMNAQKPNTTFYTEADGERVLVGSAYIRSADWYMIGLVPHTYIISELDAIRKNLIYICLLIVLLAGALAMWIYRSINKPMRDLLQYAKQIKLGRLETRLSRTHPDEMGRLSETIDQMVARLKLLIYQVEEEQQAKREAELKMLQAQINPHFLFNTLNSLKWSAMMSGNEVVEQGIGSLSELLRNTILVKEEMIPLEKEIDNLLHYAVIQRIRYGDSFKLECSMSDELLYRCLVPRFILQPIVENSIIHAGSSEGRRVHIRVEGEIVEGILQLTIADDGKGFDMAEVQERKQSHEKLSGIGMSNVDERIRLHVGRQYGIEIKSELNVGTETLIRLPILMKEGQIDV
ncbi:sensor histidine kinase [Paenibacillus sp. JDR-2]|uniref:sensor histidine kinase n=1 Tax=Paenibacillus sp. (strain JDR-2) TaxID=324057 RepID=UPI000166A359|nr:sensor histidine kinase [Paenibacillus sp. JDR-2]ACT00428.1 putative sensor with HAMP domain [Paenibacillus sp. JDR-2]